MGIREKPTETIIRLFQQAVLLNEGEGELKSSRWLYLLPKKKKGNFEAWQFFPSNLEQF